MRYHIHLCSWPSFKLACFSRIKCFPLICLYQQIVRHMNQFSAELLYFLSVFNQFLQELLSFLSVLDQFSVELLYFLCVSTLGFLILMASMPRTEFRPRNLDLFFTSVSATTVSSLSTVEMEVFSNAQLIVITILMFIGGEVFISIVELHIRSFKLRNSMQSNTKVGSLSSNSSFKSPEDLADQIELGIIATPSTATQRQNCSTVSSDSSHHLMLIHSVKFLRFVVSGYFLSFHILGISLVFFYTNFVSSAKEVLRKKDLNQVTFAIFTTVSTIARCGFIPTNENMMVFRKNSGLLLILIPQILFGNSLFPSCLRYCIWILAKIFKKPEAEYLLQNTKEIGYFHLLPGLHSSYLAVTVFGFILIQFILFSFLEWNSAALNGLNNFQKIVGVFFQTTNSRHTGETIVDLSTIAPAILVLFLVMMYLPPYTSFLTVKGEEQSPKECEMRRKRSPAVNLIFSELSYVAVFILLICITERTKMKEDPLNFNVLNITVEVVSAYGNVGFSTGYSCERQLKPDPTCVDKWYGFSGKWSDEGKLILIVVMFFGRLKKFNMDGGKAWKLL